MEGVAGVQVSESLELFHDLGIVFAGGGLVVLPKLMAKLLSVIALGHGSRKGDGGMRTGVPLGRPVVNENGMVHQVGRVGVGVGSVVG